MPKTQPKTQSQADRARQVLGLKTETFTLIELKRAFRDQMRIWHPDVTERPQEDALERAKEISGAYDFLQKMLLAQGDGRAFAGWSRYVSQNVAQWEKIFIARWQIAVKLSYSDPDPKVRGLHFNTVIIRFREGYIEPPLAWFFGAIFPEPTEENQKQYREHLLRIAPNQKLREEWAKKYWQLEFKRPYTFYLPASKSTLSDPAFIEAETKLLG